ncbi:MAG: protein-disulfide reductase DsbD N-terminal domain-containing protein [Caulobacteraceae bacterium]
MAFDVQQHFPVSAQAGGEFCARAISGKAKLAEKLRALSMGAGLAALVLASAASAQPSFGPDTVSWSASAPSQAVKPGGRVKVTLRGVVQPGWHVYGLQQEPDGPNPLRVSLDASAIAASDGEPTGTAPIKQQDPSFNLETQYYERDFTVTAPVRIGAKTPAGPQQIPISVRFQTCNGHICQPPKTVRLSVPINIRANG